MKGVVYKRIWRKDKKEGNDAIILELQKNKWFNFQSKLVTQLSSKMFHLNCLIKLMYQVGFLYCIVGHKFVIFLILSKLVFVIINVACHLMLVTVLANILELICGTI